MMRRWPFGGTCDVRIPTAGLTNANVVNPKTYHFADSSKRLTGMPQTKAARKRVTMIAEPHQWTMTEVITKKDSGRSIPFFQIISDALTIASMFVTYQHYII